MIGKAKIAIEQLQDGPIPKTESKIDFSIPPPVSYESVVAAVNHFGINVDGTVASIRVSSVSSHKVCGTPKEKALCDIGIGNLKIAGLARRSVLENCSVVVFPETFTSWAELATTLAHEIVHCHQNNGYKSSARLLDIFTASKFNLLRKMGNADEAEAYKYESDNAERFGVGEFSATLAYYNYLSHKGESGVFSYLVD